MKLYQLQYFKEVCVQNGITKAAESLHISQPAISNAIKELEEEFDLKLFKRINKKMILTKEGAYFLLEVEELLNKADELTEKMYHLGKQKSVVRLGLPPMIGAMSISLIKAFRKTYPDIELELLDGRSLTLRRKLQEDQVDVIIVSGRNTDLDNLEGCVLQQTEYMFCVNAGHPLSGEKSISIVHAALEPLVMVKDSFYVREKVQELFQKGGCTARVAWNTDQLYTSLQLIRRGMGAGFVFREIIEREPGIVGLSLDPPLMIDIEMAWMKNGVSYRSINAFIHFAKEYTARKRLSCLE